MAYPFTYFPSLDELTKTLTSDYKVKIKKLTGAVNVGSNQSVKMDYFFRQSGSKKLIYPIPDIKPTDRLTPNILRSILRALEIPLADFGFTLE